MCVFSLIYLSRVFWLSGWVGGGADLKKKINFLFFCSLSLHFPRFLGCLRLKPKGHICRNLIFSALK